MTILQVIWLYYLIWNVSTKFPTRKYSFQTNIFSAGDAAGRKVNSILSQKIMLQHENCLLWTSGNSRKGGSGLAPFLTNLGEILLIYFAFFNCPVTFPSEVNSTNGRKYGIHTQHTKGIPASKNFTSVFYISGWTWLLRNQAHLNYHN